jgi:hypothetical protein
MPCCRYTKEGAAAAGFTNPKKGVCYAYQRGECTRGDACIFRHDTGEGKTDEATMQKYKEYRDKAKDEKK